MEYMKKLILTTVFLLVSSLLFLGCRCDVDLEGDKDVQKKQPAQEKQAGPSFPGWKAIANSEGGYSFEYPKSWNAAINEYITTDSLFGPMADSKTGLGGVEVREYSGDVDAYLGYLRKNSDINYTSENSVTVDGADGIRADYLSQMSGGVSVFLKKNGKVYNIYMNTNDEINKGLFDQLISTFKFE